MLGAPIGRGPTESIGIDDDLDELLKRADEITARELYTLRVQA
jgi:hypothetical protein